MKEFIAGVAAGFILLLLSLTAIVVFGLRKAVSKRGFGDTYHQRVKAEFPSEQLLRTMQRANRVCKDLDWLNLSLQRFFYELTRSHTFKEKMKSILVSKMGIAFSTGILKRIRFKEVDIGLECPYIRKIRALSEEEVELLFKSKKMKEEEFWGSSDSGSGEEAERPRRADRRPADIESDEENLFRNREEESGLSGETDRSSATEKSERRRPSALFRQVYLLMDIEYSAVGNCMYIDADLIKGYSIPAIVKIEPFVGQLVLRVPANNYSTRMELCFVRNPGFNFSVEAAVSKNDSLFFSRSVSSILKRLFRYTMNMYIYPNWYYYYLPMLVSRSKIVNYPYYPVTSMSRDAAFLQAREATNLFGLDYKILARKDSIIFRRTNATVNNTGLFLYKTEIPVKKDLQKLVEENFMGKGSGLTRQPTPQELPAALPEQEEQGAVGPDEAPPGEAEVIGEEGEEAPRERASGPLPEAEAARFYPPFTIDIFKDVVSDYEGTRVIEQYDEYVSRIHLTIKKEVYEFTRIQYKNLLIYQLTDPSEPFFIALKLEEPQISVVQFTNRDSPFRLSRFRIAKLRSKLEKQPMKIFGSANLFRLVNFSIKKAEKTKEYFFKKKKEKRREGKEDVTRDISKMQYISDERIKDAASASSVFSEDESRARSGVGTDVQNLSEANIIESHFIAEESKLLNSERIPECTLRFPGATISELFEALTKAEVRASLFREELTLMDDVHLNDRLVSTSMIMVREAKQYVQLLSYFNRAEGIVIERILLSEDYLGKTVIMKIEQEGDEEGPLGDATISVFFPAPELALDAPMLEWLVSGHLQICRLLGEGAFEPAQLTRAGKFYQIEAEAPGIELVSEPRIVAAVKIEKDGVSFDNTLVIDGNATVLLIEDEAEGGMKLSLQIKRGNITSLRVRPGRRPPKDKRVGGGLLCFEFKAALKKKEEVSVDTDAGLVFWEERSKGGLSGLLSTAEWMREVSGKGHLVTRSKGRLRWTNATGGEVEGRFRVGVLARPAPGGTAE